MKNNFVMIRKIIILFIIFISSNAFALIEVDITRGNLDPLPLAVSPLSIDDQSRKSFEKILKEKHWKIYVMKYMKKFM